MKIKLTKRSVEAIEPGERDVYVWDSEIAGFGVKVTPRRETTAPRGPRVTGGARVYLLQYSRRDRTRRVTIGRHGDGGLTADQARREVEVLRGIIRNGGDPAAERARQRAIPTMRGLAERYMAEHAVPKKKPRSAESDKTLIGCHILPLLGDRVVSDITRADLRRFIQDVATGNTQLDEKTGLLRGQRIVRGGKGVANRSLTLLSRMFALAEDWGIGDRGTIPAAWSSASTKPPAGRGRGSCPMASSPGSARRWRRARPPTGDTGCRPTLFGCYC